MRGLVARMFAKATHAIALLNVPEKSHQALMHSLAEVGARAIQIDGDNSIRARLTFVDHRICIDRPRRHGECRPSRHVIDQRHPEQDGEGNNAVATVNFCQVTLVLHVHELPHHQRCLEPGDHHRHWKVE